ncbi:MAG: glutamate--tRNA ligase family protein [Bacteroidota bacterium]
MPTYTGNNASLLRTRIAPTPSGYLHIGNAFSFVLTALICYSQKGELRLRIDDLDEQRKRPEYVEDIFDSLDWLGIPWQVGPSGPGDFEANFAQRHRRDLYEDHLTQLSFNEEVYRCICSRKILQQQLKRGILTCPCLLEKQNFDANAVPVAWRMPTPPEVQVEWRDLYLGMQRIRPVEGTPNFVVRKKDGFPAYQLTSLVDDSLYQTNLVVRGADLLPSTAAQLYLADRLALTPFPKASFVHHPLLVDSRREKLSKSTGGRSLLSIRSKHRQPEILYRYFSRLLKLPQRGNTFEELLSIFPSVYPPIER